MKLLIDWMERRLLPDPLVRFGIRRLLTKRLKEVSQGNGQERMEAFIETLRGSPVAVLTEKANEQHYEVPAEFFLEVLGPRLKYSSCYYPEGVDDLAAAEEKMLALTCERAELRDGMDVLELGCGWGSLTLWMAEQYPNSRITSVSNSNSQRMFIEGRARDRGLNNVRVITADMKDFTIDEKFDRVVSVEMFEHMRNYEELLGRVASWLRDDGQLFLHIFCHRQWAYPFETTSDEDWMGRYFFTGGLMPSETLMQRFDRDLVVTHQWRVNGIHYARTLLAWLQLMDAKEATVMPMLKKIYGEAEGARWFQRWRVFFIACEELFRYRSGEEWFVTHLVMRKKV